MQKNPAAAVACILQNRRPYATAEIKGSNRFPDILGKAAFYTVQNGTLLTVFLTGLPTQPEHRVFGFHIHEGDRCTGNAEDPFADAKAHYNPQNTLHPYHAGDLPPVFSNEGWAWYAVITTRFHSEEIIGKTMILHAMPDDLMTQPSGNSGEKIACGVIRKTGSGFPRSRIY